MIQNMKLERPCKGVVSLAIPTPLPIGDVNVYLLEGDAVTLVDTGPNTEEAWSALTSGIQAAGYQMTDIKQIVLTHFHEDHTGLAKRLKQETGAKILAHPAANVWLQGAEWFTEWKIKFFTELYVRSGLNEQQIQGMMRIYAGFQKFGCTIKADAILIENEPLPAHPDWEVVYTPGHSQAHLSLFRPADGCMILGDHLIAHISANALIEPSVRLEGERAKPLVVYRAELKKLAQMPVRIGLSGHGAPIFEHANLIQKRFKSMERRGAAILSFLAGGKKTAAEIAFHLFPRHQDQLPLILSETIGHLDWLETEGLLMKTVNEGRDLYSADLK